MKYYLITGASSGIGREMAKSLSDSDTMIILVARRQEKLLEVQKELKGKSMVIPCDLTKTDEIESVFHTLQEEGIRLDGLIYCAGIAFIKTLKLMERDDLENMFRVNVFGFYEMCRHFQNVKASNKGAAIVGISSYAATMKEPGMSAYAMTKEAMNTQVQILAKEFLKRRIRINAVMPANVMSKMCDDNNDWTEEEIAELTRKQPLGVIPIANVISTVQFLLSEDAKYITGECIGISAGYHG